MQGPDGGFHTGYDKNGIYAGTQENAETTSIAIITLYTSEQTLWFPFAFLQLPFWITYFYVDAIAASATAVGLVLWFEGKKETAFNYPGLLYERCAFVCDKRGKSSLSSSSTRSSRTKRLCPFSVVSYTSPFLGTSILVVR